jgi:hypothetical protein
VLGMITMVKATAPGVARQRLQLPTLFVVGEPSQPPPHISNTWLELGVGALPQRNECV